MKTALKLTGYALAWPAVLLLFLTVLTLKIFFGIFAFFTGDEG